MPCISGPSYEDGKREEERKHVEKAMLCAALSYIDELKGDFDDFVKTTIWEEQGITASAVRSWWSNHREQDELRKKQEKLQRERQDIISGALQKLSAKERKALGLI